LIFDILSLIWLQLRVPPRGWAPRLARKLAGRLAGGLARKLAQRLAPELAQRLAGNQARKLAGRLARKLDGELARGLTGKQPGIEAGGLAGRLASIRKFPISKSQTNSKFKFLKNLRSRFVDQLFRLALYVKCLRQTQATNYQNRVS
jgi:hypothetical protein